MAVFHIILLIFQIIATLGCGCIYYFYFHTEYINELLCIYNYILFGLMFLILVAIIVKKIAYSYEIELPETIFANIPTYLAWIYFFFAYLCKFATVDNPIKDIANNILMWIIIIVIIIIVLIIAALSSYSTSEPKPKKKTYIVYEVEDDDDD